MSAWVIMILHQGQRTCGQGCCKIPPYQSLLFKNALECIRIHMAALQGWKGATFAQGSPAWMKAYMLQRW